MAEIKKVLFATDFSETSRNARDVACELVEKLGADLHTLHVIHNLAVEVPDFGMGLSFPSYLEKLPAMKQELSSKAREALGEEFESSWKDDHHLTYAVRFGVPASEIVEYADKNGIQMIVIGTHGRTGLTHAVLGSVAERVLQKAHCPVVTVRS